jgi:hypothetical protein
VKHVLALPKSFIRAGHGLHRWADLAEDFL